MMKFKNPLTTVSVFFVLMSVLSLTTFVLELKKDTVPIASTIDVFLCGSFFLGFFKKKVFAWWVSILYFVIMFTTNLIAKNTVVDKDWVLSLIFVHVFWLAYLIPKYKSYKNYCKNNGEINGA